MKAVSEIWTLVDGFLLRGIFISVIVILLAKLVFKNRIHIVISLNIIRISLIIHSVVYIIQFLTSLLFDNLNNTFWSRAFGPHWWAYWVMMIMNSLLPLTLLIKKVGNKNSYLLLVAILMNIGWIFESFVIHVTNIEREYMDENYNPYLPTNSETSIIINGLITGIFILLLGNLIKMKMNHELKNEN